MCKRAQPQIPHLHVTGRHPGDILTYLQPLPWPHVRTKAKNVFRNHCPQRFRDIKNIAIRPTIPWFRTIESITYTQTHRLCWKTDYRPPSNGPPQPCRSNDATAHAHQPGTRPHPPRPAPARSGRHRPAKAKVRSPLRNRILSSSYYMREILRDFGFAQTAPTQIYEDSLACVAMSENPRRRKFSRHIDIRRYFVRDMVSAGSQACPSPYSPYGRFWKCQNF